MVSCRGRLDSQAGRSCRRLGRESDPQPAGDRHQAALQRGRLEHDRRRDTAAGQDVVHQVVVERRVERPREQDDRLVGEMPSPDGAQPGDLP